MMFSFEGRPSDSAYVDGVWRTNTETSGSFTSVAQINWGMVIWRYQGKTALTVRGPETQATPAAFPADCEFFGIRFKLGTFMPHLPAKMVMDRRDLNMPEACNNSFWFNSSTWELPTFENADTFVNRLVREGLLVHEPVVDTVLQGQPHDLSLRSVQYRFLHATGLTQKTVHQIERAQQAAALLAEGVSILDTVYQAGYFDQAHLTRSLKRFMGQTPMQIVDLRKSEQLAYLYNTTPFHTATLPSLNINDEEQ
jgi:AraC-like DNA-binding protein